MCLSLIRVCRGLLAWLFALIGLFIGTCSAYAGQLVFLDFDTATTAGEHIYTPSERNAVQAQMEDHYSAFDFFFTQTTPGPVDFSTLFFNGGVTGGLAQHIDFRNLDKNDAALININGLGLSSSADIVSASAFLGSHELGHLQGLRHGDAFGPIGSGLSSTGVPGPGSYAPAYPGPENADETTNHLMATPLSVGLSLSALLTPSWFSERSAVKLAFNESGAVEAEVTGTHGTLTTAQPITLADLSVPNTLVSGHNAGRIFDVEALAVLGEILTPGEVDLYTFAGFAGDLINLEVISQLLDHRLLNTIDPVLRILDSTGTEVDYYGSSALNDNEFESVDSILIDLILPSDDTYYIEVSSGPLFTAFDTGSYELFVQRFDPVPEPGTLVLSLTGGVGLFAWRWRRRRAAV